MIVTDGFKVSSTVLAIHNYQKVKQIRIKLKLNYHKATCNLLHITYLCMYDDDLNTRCSSVKMGTPHGSEVDTKVG